MRLGFSLKTTAVGAVLLCLGAPRSAAADEQTALAAAVQDVPSYQGQPGLLWVLSAMPSHEGRIAMAGRLGFMDVGSFVGTGKPGTFLTTRMAFDYSFFPWLDAGLALHLASSSSSALNPTTQTFGTDAFPRVRAATSFGDFSVAALAGLRLIGGVNELAFDFGATGADFRAMGSYAPRALGEAQPLRFHLNVGYTLDRSGQLATGPRDNVYRFESSIAEGNWAEYGIGVEYQQRLLTPFAEATLDQALGSHSGIGPSRVAVGVRSSPLSGLVLELSGEVGANGSVTNNLPPAAPYLIVFGVGYTFAPFTRVEVRHEVEQVHPLEGLIIDVATSKPVSGAHVAFAQ
jgi:hypothetical protein